MAWHEYPTNFSNGTVVDGAGSFFWKYPQSIIGQFGNGIVLLIWLMVFLVSSPLGITKGLLAASFITFILTLPLAVQGLINPIISIVLIILTIIGLIGSKSEGGY